MGKSIRSFFAGLVLIISCWWACVAIFGIQDYILPDPLQVIYAFLNNYSLLLTNSYITVFSALAGLFLAICIGLSMAILLQIFPSVDRSIQPFVAGFQSFPKESISPLLVVWFGYGYESKILLAASIAFFPIFSTSIKGFKSIPSEVLYTCRALRGSKYKILFDIRFPFALPFIFSGLRVAMTLSLVGAVIGEFVAGNGGIGRIIINANAQFKIDLAFAAIILLGCIGLLFDSLLVMFEKMAIPWHESIETNS